MYEPRNFKRLTDFLIRNLHMDVELLYSTLKERLKEGNTHIQILDSEDVTVYNAKPNLNILRSIQSGEPLGLISFHGNTVVPSTIFVTEDETRTILCEVHRIEDYLKKLKTFKEELNLVDLSNKGWLKLTLLSETKVVIRKEDVLRISQIENNGSHLILVNGDFLKVKDSVENLTKLL